MTQAVGPQGQTVDRPKSWLADAHGLRLWPYITVTAVLIIVSLVASVGSDSLDALIRPDSARSWHSSIHSLTSVAAILALSSVLFVAYRRLQQRNLRWNRLIMWHSFLAVGFWLSHVVLMVGSRKLIYGLMGATYDFSNSRPLLQMLYEGAKDIPTYGLLISLLVISDYYLRPKLAVSQVSAQERLTFRSGSQAYHLLPADIIWVAAAGNYAELYICDRALPLLIRTGLDDLHKRLPSDFVRIHKSRLVNRRFITDTRTAPSGDFEITLTTGTILRGSRRYRKDLTAS
ncbi:LytTR family DNA-binding domain-containing protein [Asticcacaulis tiandongensis]|uniref:LytTR family DNA-binding domain-containing protein n=1 Tax=Asticcacaulis tiandongensis TaxID=2565365 RepID=UPI0015E85D80|nr:LytTR family DNA-binding domain-containing protein [Asticcacaulis tiandongensis]